MIIELTEEEMETIFRLSSYIKTDSSEEPGLLQKQSTKFANFIPERIIKILQNFSKLGSETGFLLIKTKLSEKDKYTKTPNTNHLGIGQNTDLAKIQSLFLHSFSDMIAYEAEGNGSYFQDIIPIQTMEKQQTSISSRTELEIHTEQAFSKVRPDILSLSCIHGDPNAMTYILPLQTILHNLSSEEIQYLREPQWKIGVDLSFKQYGHEFIEGDIRGPIPILYDSTDDPKLVFDQDLMIGINEKAEKMKQKIVDIYYTHRIQYNLKPGEIIFIDNHRATHGRSPFSPRYDGYDRFLIRSFAIYDYERIKYACPIRDYLVSASYS